MLLAKTTLIIITALYHFACLGASIDHERISKLYKTSSSQYKFKAQQKYKGIPIFGAFLVLSQHSIDSVEATPIFGTWFDENIINIDIHDINPKISSFEALEIAVNTLNIIPFWNESILNIYHDAKRNTFDLSYIVKLSYIDNDMMMILNANTAEILEIYDANRGFMDVCGVGGNDKIGAVRYCGEKALSINSINAAQMQPILANHYVQIYDNLNSDYSNTASALLMRCTLNTSSSNYQVVDRVINGGYCAGCDVFEFTNFIFDLFIQYMDTLPVSDEHIPLSAYVHVGMSWDSSHYDNMNGAIHFGDGDGSRYPLSVIDIVGHEIGHAFTAKTSNLISSDESGAIDNFYADLIGEIAEYFYYGSNDWRVGANSYRAIYGTDRYLDAPTLDGVSIDNYNDYYAGMNPYYASGIYSKAIYLLNTQYAWSMLDIFKVFTRSNELYWSPRIRFNDALCGVYQSLTDLYGSNQTKILSMSHGLSQAFQAVSLECQRNQTVSNCGNNENTYCIYKEIKPSLSEDTIFAVQIALPQHKMNTETNVHIYLSIKQNECKAPSISLEYEQIDLDGDDEFILIKDHDGNVVRQCGTDWRCGQWNTTCFMDYKLGIRGIHVDNTYSITLQISSEVDALCGDRSNVINANLILKCALHTPQPTYPPPTASPIPLAPSTSSPTPIPTHPLIKCGLYNNCYLYNVDVYPSNDSHIQSVIAIQNIDLNADVYYHINFNINGDYDCISPTLTVFYETIDYDQATEYIAIYDDSNGGKQIAHCSGTADCGNFARCLMQYPLTNKIVSGTTYNISLMESRNVDAMCSSHDWSINARLELNCDGGTAKPTQIPSPEPTSTPIVPTAGPPSVSPTHQTSNPTMAPTTHYTCGTNTFCSNVDVIPISDGISLWNHTLQYADSRADRYFSVLFNVMDRYCVNPSISILYQQIDYDGSDEYFDVLDNDGLMIQRCGDKVSCNVFDDCLVDYNLRVNGIAPNTTYQINIFQPKSVDAQCINNPFSLNADIILRCNAGSMNPTNNPSLQPSISPTTPTIDPTPSPTYYRQHCGLNKYCYHMHIYPQNDTDTEWKVAIQNANDSTETYFDIWIVPYLFDCVAPTISLQFERIDYNAFSEYILISGADGFSDIRCGGDRVDNECGVFDICFSNTSLGVNRIKREDSYKLSVFESDQVEAECQPLSYLSINAVLSITCYGISSKPTSSPTPEPTTNPSQTTDVPSRKPTEQPTDLSQAPTRSPTHDIVVCGEHKYCIFEEINPVQSTDTTFDIPIQNVDESADIFYDVYFIPNDLECINPSISFIYEGIDYDQSYETINISDKNGVLLSECTGEAFGCGSFVGCLSDYDLNIQKIEMNASYLIQIAQSGEVDALCVHDLALNAVLSITCHNTDSIIPTDSPTPEPTNNPTGATLVPSYNPSISPTTPSPTHLMQTCGLHTYCIYVDLYPSLDIDTEYAVPIVHNDVNTALQFNVIFAVQNDIECNGALISFNLELIDVDDDDEYVNITGIDGKELAICGAISYGQDCGVFVDCFKNIKIGENINKIGLSSTYKIGVYVTQKVDALCRSYHRYSINSVLRLKCLKGTSQPTLSPITSAPTITTFNPTQYPTLSPTEPSPSPTLSPTWTVLCAINTWCYHIEISPSMTSESTWTVPIQFDDSNSNWNTRGTTFRVIYHVSGIASNQCVAPKLSFVYETIDYDGDFEYINVADSDGYIIAECGIHNPDAECNVFESCFDNVLLINKIEIDQDYEILIYQPSDVDSLCSSIHNPYSLNATLILKCDSGTATPSVLPTQPPSMQPTVSTTTPTTTSPTRATATPTEAPTYKMISCGKEIYCIYVNMFPQKEYQTSYSVQIQRSTPFIKQNTVFDVYFISNLAECVEPFITFSFERIDYDEIDEYLNISYSNSVIQCGAGGKGYNKCGEYDICLNESLHNIGVNETYKISVIRSAEVSALCWDTHDWAINAELMIICNKGTASPTYDPTHRPTLHPTSITIAPTQSPSIPPTVSTLNPTISPTFSHHLCELGFTANKWCYFAQIYPMDNELTETKILIKGEDDGKETAFYITFNPESVDCLNPLITIRYENIDLNGDDEFIQIFDDEMVLLRQCGAIWKCNTFDFCLKNYELNTSQIGAGTNYTITIIEEDQVDGLCDDHSYSLNAEITLKCNNKIVEIDNDNKCGDNKYCFQNIMRPKSILETEWTQRIQHLNHEETTQFEIRFIAQNERCYQPKLEIIYELIDFDETDEFIDVFDNNSVLINRCGANKLHNECGLFDICIDDYLLPTPNGFIEMSDEYKISLFESKNVDAICSNHSYSINAILNIKCAPKTNQINTKNITINIEGSNNVNHRLFENLITANTEIIYVNYNINHYQCLNPTFSLSTNIKVNAKYLQNVIIYNHNLDKIGQCISTDNPIMCPRSMQCVNHYELNNNSLQIGEIYTFIIYIIVSADNHHNWCDIDHSIQSQLSFYCNGIPSISPTSAPTTTPSFFPTQSPTLTPTILSTLTTNYNQMSIQTSINSKRIIILIVIVISSCIICLLIAVCLWFHYGKKGKVSWQYPTETEMQETNRLAVSPDSRMTQPMSDDGEYHAVSVGISTKKRKKKKYTKIGEQTDDNDDIDSA